MSKHVTPTVAAVSFSCPHCGALALQTWYELYATKLGKDETPRIPDSSAFDDIEADPNLDDNVRQSYREWVKRMTGGQIFLADEPMNRYPRDLNNLWVSQCYACNSLALWKHTSLLFPSAQVTIRPNPDLADDIKADFREAESILIQSPRGAAALLRLAIQKLCIQLGCPAGNSIDANIALLVGRGLDERMQQALDTVRVVGNEAVHPGELDLRDNTEMATRLFELVNLIAEEMVSRPKRVKEMYDRIPEGKRQSIEARNAKALGAK
ncbi:DUF4145 domain-containing protein [Ralstonia sp. CHL-2022]|uniref:DUF4145 domain-containing protein n=1 Tax=Ralstonia mojiangensis TaxID=2953895 RepID=UPI0021B4B733|nr:DUF4145 domain-containing protein [Ralstonia mojiangensis]MCT7295585.1 DUF4145 domain-containing protein [Ralstonia mojiangensis]